MASMRMNALDYFPQETKRNTNQKKSLVIQFPAYYYAHALATL